LAHGALDLEAQQRCHESPHIDDAALLSKPSVASVAIASSKLGGPESRGHNGRPRVDVSMISDIKDHIRQPLVSELIYDEEWRSHRRSHQLGFAFAERCL
jgi:hypothetical protein